MAEVRPLDYEVDREQVRQFGHIIGLQAALLLESGNPGRNQAVIEALLAIAAALAYAENGRECDKNLAAGAAKDCHAELVDCLARHILKALANEMN